MRHFNKSKIILVGMVSGLMLALSANPAKAADVRIGIGFNLGHHHDYYNRYHHAPVISYRHYDHHDRHYYKKHHKHWKHQSKHRKYYSKHDRYSGKYRHHRDYRQHDRYSGYRHHDRGTSIRHNRH